jgi:hypothetical protein
LGLSSAIVTSAGTVVLATPLATPIVTGTPIWLTYVVGPDTFKQRLVATAYAGVEQDRIFCTSPIGDIPSGATVAADRRAKVGRLKADFKSSFGGIRVQDADVLGLDLSGIAYTGRYALRATLNSFIELVGGDLPFVGRAGGDCRTIRLEGDSRISIDGITAEKHAGVGSHIQLLDNTSMMISNSRIEDVADFIAIAADGAEYVEWANNQDFAGQVVSHPFRRGSEANGEWVKHEDGTMECWLRNVTIPIGGYTWTYPETFISASTVAVSAQSRDVATPIIAGASSSSAASATIQLWTVAGATVAGSANLFATGRWRD